MSLRFLGSDVLRVDNEPTVDPDLEPSIVPTRSVGPYVFSDHRPAPTIESPAASTDREAVLSITEGLRRAGAE